MKFNDKAAQQKWDSYVSNMRKSTPIPKETKKEQSERIKRLEKYPEEWFAFYFPNYYTAAPAKFHIAASRRLFKNPRWYEVRRWSRELAKSTRGMMEDLYMAMTGMASVFILVSHSNTNAAELLMPYLLNLEANDRLIYDYGTQKGYRRWEIGKFVTREGCSFRALGAKESPRGTRNEEKRPDVIRVDDIDTDERCKNDKRMSELWSWVEKALIPTISVSGNARIVFQGNLIAKNSIIAKASLVADKVETINIRDKNGVSSWGKNSEEQIDWILSKLSYLAIQQEYYNNPIRQGTVFQDMVWDKVPALSKFRFLVLYGDPAPSNKDLKNNSTKGVFLLGKIKDKIYIIDGFLENNTNQKFIEWYYTINETVGDKCIIYNYMENNSLQDPFYKQVYQPLMKSVGKNYDKTIYVLPDERKKPDKFTRIEGNLDPLHRAGNLIFNKAKKQDKHMKLLAEQFEAVEPSLGANADGPDAVEGGVWIINDKIRLLGPIEVHNNKRRKNRY